MRYDDAGRPEMCTTCCKYIDHCRCGAGYTPDPRDTGPDCRECGDSGESDDGQPCQECCPHDEHDHGICLDCGLDRTEDLAARAYDHAKGSAEDGY